MQDFINTYNGVKTGTNDANFAECVGLVQKWFQTVGAPFFYGDAKDLYNNAPDSAYTKGTSWPAPEGAATVLNSSWGGGAGHTQLSTDGQGVVFEQNNPYGHAPVLSRQTSKPSGWIGWILPKNYKGGSMTAEQIAEIRRVDLNNIGQEVSVIDGESHVQTIIDNIRRLQGGFRDNGIREKQMKDLAVKLGLPADAPWDQVVAAAGSGSGPTPTILKPGTYKVS